MRIITWNINSIRRRVDLLARLDHEQKPDVIALQETKVEDHLFPEKDISKLGYVYQYYLGQKSYNGVAILSKIPFQNKFSLSLYNNDKRHVAVNIKGFEIHNFYIPAGGDIPDIIQNPKFKHKIEYLYLIREWFINNRVGIMNKLILLGDFNIAPYEHDVWSSKCLRDVVSHTFIEREELLKLKHSMNFTDAMRINISPYKKLYTWWSYRNVDWKKSNRGRRLDHIWVNNNLKETIKSSQILLEVRSWLNPSDHVPCLIHIQ